MCVTLQETATELSEVVVPFFISNVKGKNCSTDSSTLGIVSLYFSHFNGCIELSCGISLHFPADKMLSVFMCLLTTDLSL